MQREKEALGDITFSHNLMAPCVVGKGQRSIHRSDAPNMMGRCACSMPPGSLSVALGLLPHPLSRTWHLHQKTSSCQRCPASPAADGTRRAAAFALFCPCPSSRPLGGLVTLSAAPRVDTMATEPPGHGGGCVRSTAF